MLKRLPIVLLLSLFAVTGLAGCDSDQNRSQVYPASFSPGEEKILTTFTANSFIFDFILELEDQDTKFNIWIEHYEKGQLQSPHRYLVGMIFTPDLPERVIEDRIIIGLIHQEDRELWITSVGGGKSQIELPKFTGPTRTWGSTPNMDIVMGKPIILGFVAAGDQARPPQQSIYDGDQDAFNEFVNNNDDVCLIYMKVDLD